ncbi:MAG: aminotransferase class I/II-fold pyridoxal phosphate-dependent enzyme [Clostridia bacterium]|nr:aminotransferase class I/II-fold pyridoxal phosphate-dependent enzyme [Clostridia bacterium]
MNIGKLLNQKVVDMKPSGIRKFFDIVATMPDAISLGVGEPDFVTPWHIREAGIYSLEKGHTYYTSNSGLEELRFEICNYLNRRFNLTYNYKNEVLITVGGSEAIDLATRAFISAGDEVLIPEPCFVCYAPCVTMAGGTPVPIVTVEEDEFKLTAKALKAAITPKTKMLVLPFPNNPTGAIMDRQDLEEIAEVLRGTDIIVLSDEIYAELTYGQKHVSIAEIDGMKERTIIASGFSKAFAMTGWRLGYIVGDSEVIKAMTKIHQYGIMSTPTTSQYAAIEAMKNGDEDVSYMVSEYDHRRKMLVEELNRMGLHCFEPKGAFYAFPSIQSTGLTSEQFCEELLKDQKVAVVPGNAFGESGEGFVRISYAYSVENISNALEKIDAFIKKFK